MRTTLGLGLLAFLISCNNPTTKGVSADKKLIRYLPSGITLLAGVNVQSLTASALYRRHEQDLNVRQFLAMQNDSGIDPRKDINQALITWYDNVGVLLAQGHFNNLKQRRGVILPEADILAAGPPAYLQQISAEHGEIPEALRQQMSDLPRTDQLWIVSSRGLPLDRVPGSPDVRSALSNIADNIRAFNVGVGIDDGAHLQGTLACDSEAGAKRVHDGLRGMIGLARLMTRDDQLSRLKLYDAIQVDQDHSNVRVHADLSAAEADSAIALVRGLGRL